MPKFDSTYGTVNIRNAGTVLAGKEIVYDDKESQLVAGRPPARGVSILVTTAFAGGTNITAKLQGRDTATGSWIDILTLATRTQAQLTKGSYVYQGAFPPVNYKRARIAITSTGTFTAGTLAVSFPDEAAVADSQDRPDDTFPGAYKVDEDSKGNDLIDR